MSQTTLTQPTKLSEKISELKKRAGHIIYRPIEIRASDNKDIRTTRVIKGYLASWGTRNSYGEKVVKGCAAKSIRERGPGSQSKYKITFLWMHDITDPLAVFAVLREDEYGLYFETMPLDNVPNADRCIEQIISGTLNQFSIGFYYIWDKIEYDETDDSLVLLEIDLIEGSVVTLGADDGTYAIRSGTLTEEQIHDQIDEFIETLPRKDRLQARQLFTLQKSLVATQKTRDEELGKHKPAEKRGQKPNKQVRKIRLELITKKL